MNTLVSHQHGSWVERGARKLLFYQLTQLQGVGLSLRENNEHFFFGDQQAPLQARIQVHDPAIYPRLLCGGSIAAAQTWVEQGWSSPELSTVMRVFSRCLQVLDNLDGPLTWLSYPAWQLLHLLNRNSRDGSRANIAAHYDLGNELYRLFLDDWMQYSSAIFASPEQSLAQAQEHKLQLICEKLQLRPEDHLLEIGSGWGGLACYAAKHYGCQVTTTTLSQEQFRLASERIEQMGLQDRVTLLLKDYRDLEGQFDKLVSIEMIEAVGYRYLGDYFSALERLLKPNGRLLIQAISIADQRFDSYRKQVDFIQRYIFPGGFLPCLSELCQRFKRHSSMTVTAVSSHGLDYARTLSLWAQRFQRATPALQKAGYSEDFQRLWAFYFAYAEGGFREGLIDLLQIEAAKPEARRCQAGASRNY